MKLKLCINTGFAINRYQTPEEWGKFVGDLGVKSVQLTASLLNPFWDKCYQDDLVERIKRAMDTYGFSVDSIFTDAYTRVNHLVSDDERARDMWLSWLYSYFELGARLGAKTGGSHFGSLTFEGLKNFEKMRDIGVKNWQKVTKRAQELGYASVIFEPMSVPREFANTVGDTLDLVDRVNADCGVPFEVCLDVGHAPHPDERDCYPWIEKLGAISPVVHLQQTKFNFSNHWSFTDEYNAQGYITGERVIECLEKSGCKETLMTLELSHREHVDTDYKVFDDHKASVHYWRKFIQE